MTGAAFYLTRLAVKNPEVTWHPKKNQEPWEEYKSKQYKVCFIRNYNNFVVLLHIILFGKLIISKWLNIDLQYLFSLRT